MELKRDELLDLMGNIDLRDKSNEEKKQIIIQKIMDVMNYMRDRYPYDSYSLDRKKRFLSGREIGTLMDSIKRLDENDFAEAYFEICDFVHDNGTKDNPILKVGESDIVHFQLERIVNAINVNVN